MVEGGVGGGLYVGRSYGDDADPPDNTGPPQKQTDQLSTPMTSTTNNLYADYRKYLCNTIILPVQLVNGRPL